ncbi:hypothetical protein ACEQHT_001303, partial [Campylobacter lari]
MTIGNNGTLIIEKEGSVIVSNNPSVDISSDSKNIEIINKGSISGPDRAGIRINGNNNQLTQINNSGEINGGHGITFNGSNNTLDNLTNSGVIQGTNSGINIQGSNNTIKSIINNGTITGGSNGISVSNGTIKSINNNGTIKSINIQSNGTIENIINDKDIGSIRVNQSSINYLVNNGVLGRISFGESATWGSSSLGTIENNGIIQNGIYYNRMNGDKIINTGTILGENAFKMESHNDNSLKTFENKGVISGSDKGFNIINDKSGSKIGITLLKNHSKGTIYGGNDGIYLYGMYGYTGSIGTIDNEGSIIGGQNGILINNKYPPISFIQTIVNKGTILGRKNAGIFVQGKQLV